MLKATPPLCEIIDISPFGALCKATKGRQSPLSVLATVTLFGPTKRIPYLRAVLSNLFDSDWPSSLYSEKPPEGMAIRLMPYLPQRSTSSGIIGAGIMQKARSGISGKSSTLLYILMPSTCLSSPRALTPKILPR